MAIIDLDKYYHALDKYDTRNLMLHAHLRACVYLSCVDVFVLKRSA